MIQIYGKFGGTGSIDNICINLANQLVQRRAEVQVFEVNTLTPKYSKRLRAHVGLEPGAPIGIYVGYPDGSTGWLAGHSIKILYTMCEADPVPDTWVETCNRATYIFTPSQFCKTILTNCGVSVPIWVVPHGTPRVPILENVKSRTLRLFHVSGALSFPQRKGTPQLLQAFNNIYKDHDVELYVKMPLDKVEKAAAYLNNPKIIPVKGDIWDTFPAMHAVVQPSRGEGFGIVPLEGRCMGLPAVITPHSGHDQHYVEGVDVPVQAGFPTHMLTQCNAWGYAPTVSVENIEESLLNLINDYDTIRARTIEWAQHNAKYWTWDAVLSPISRQLYKMWKPIAAETLLGGVNLRGER